MLTRIVQLQGLILTVTTLLLAGLHAGSKTLADDPLRGWAGEESSKFEAINAGWYYDWGIGKTPGNYDTSFLPMFWGSGSVNTSNINTVLGYGDTTHVLGFNEPERSDQAGGVHPGGVMPISTATAKWQELQNGLSGSGIKLISPAPSDTAAGQQWLIDFMNAANQQSLQVDAVAFHWYGASSPNNPIGAGNSFLSRVDWYHNTFNRPVWITEFGIVDWGNNHTDAAMQQANAEFLDYVIPRLESRSHVEGYALYQWTNDTQIIGGNPLTPSVVGDAYVGTLEPGESLDLNGQSQGDDRVYMKGGTLTNTGAAIADAVSRLDVISGSTNELAGTGDWGFDTTGWITIRSGATLAISGTNEVTIPGMSVSNNGSLIVDSGSLKLDAGSSFSGSGQLTVDSGGTLSLGSLPDRDGIVITQPLDLQGGAIVANDITDGIHIVSGPTTVHSNSTLGGDGVLYVGSPLQAPVGGGGGGIVKAGTGITILDATNTYEGHTVVEQGTLRLTGSASVAASSQIDVRPGATLDVSGLSSTFTVVNGQTLNNDSNTTVSGDVLGSSGSTVSGAGTFANNVTMQSGGILQVGSANLPTTLGPPTFQLIDDFSSNSAGDYTKFIVLDNGGDADSSSSDSTFTISGGTAKVITSFADDVEQQLYVHSGTTLKIGEELLVDVSSISTANRDVGLFVGTASDLANATSATTSTRKNFIYVTTGSNSSTNGFLDDGSSTGTEFGLSGISDGDTLFIKRISTDEFEVGHYDNDNSGPGGRVIKKTYTGLTTNDATAVGFWTDVRAAGTLSLLDDFGFIGPGEGLPFGETMTILGDLALSSGSLLKLNLFDTTESDKLVVAGELTAAGTLAVSLDDEASGPALGESFTILGFGSTVGAFDEYDLPMLTAGSAWDVSELLTTGKLSVVVDVDTDNDGDVDGADLLALQRFDPSLIAEWEIQYGKHGIVNPASIIAPLAVPEPSVCGHIVIGLMILLSQMRAIRQSSILAILPVSSP